MSGSESVNSCPPLTPFCSHLLRVQLQLFRFCHMMYIHSINSVTSHCTFTADFQSID